MSLTNTACLKIEDINKSFITLAQNNKKGKDCREDDCTGQDGLVVKRTALVAKKHSKIKYKFNRNRKPKSASFVSRGTNIKKAKTLEEAKIDDPLVFLTEEEKSEMVASNQGLLHKIVNSFMQKSFWPGLYQRDDLVGVGMVGFTKALNSYKKDKNTKFSTYATKCITNEILYFLRKENKHNNVAHIDDPITTDKNGNALTLIDTLEDAEINVEKTVLTSESLSFLVEIIDKLSYNENYIIIHRYGLFGEECMTQKEIADVLEMSQANISKLESTILTKLRKIMMSKYGIKDLCFS